VGGGRKKTRTGKLEGGEAGGGIGERELVKDGKSLKRMGVFGRQGLLLELLAEALGELKEGPHIGEALGSAEHGDHRYIVPLIKHVGD
jgi:hypothetical protein